MVFKKWDKQDQNSTAIDVYISILYFCLAPYDKVIGTKVLLN